MHWLKLVFYLKVLTCKNLFFFNFWYWCTQKQELGWYDCIHQMRYSIFQTGTSNNWGVIAEIFESFQPLINNILYEVWNWAKRCTKRLLLVFLSLEHLGFGRGSLAAQGGTRPNALLPHTLAFRPLVCHEVASLSSSMCCMWNGTAAHGNLVLMHVNLPYTKTLFCLFCTIKEEDAYCMLLVDRKTGQTTFLWIHCAAPLPPLKITQCVIFKGAYSICKIKKSKEAAFITNVLPVVVMTTYPYNEIGWICVTATSSAC